MHSVQGRRQWRRVQLLAQKSERQQHVYAWLWSEQRSGLSSGCRQRQGTTRWLAGHRKQLVPHQDAPRVGAAANLRAGRRAVDDLCKVQRRWQSCCILIPMVRMMLSFCTNTARDSTARTCPTLRGQDWLSLPDGDTAPLKRDCSDNVHVCGACAVGGGRGEREWVSVVACVRQLPRPYCWSRSFQQQARA